MDSIATLLQEAVRDLEGTVPEPRRDAELLLSHILDRDRVFLLAHPDRPVCGSDADRFRAWVERRLGLYPIQYLIGVQEFFGRPFHVDERVLIPRPETELVVETVLRLAAPLAAPRIADVGTGSGCIAVTLACERADALLVATEVSPPALEVARMNAHNLGVAARIDFRLGSILEPLRGDAPFELIVSNPPYVSCGDSRVTPEVARYEPRAAVFSGPSGLEVLAELFAHAGPLLKPGGHLVLEIGAGQRPAVSDLAAGRDWRLCEVHRDLAGIERCLVFEN